MFLENIFNIKQRAAHTIITLFGIKISLRYFGIMQLKLCCDIEDLNYIKKQRVNFTHPIGIVINKNVKIGTGCTIRQNVTIGRGSYKESTGREYPVIGNDVEIGANSVIIGGITVGDRVTIGAGAVVVKDVPSDTVVAGNPAKIIRYKNNTNE